MKTPDYHNPPEYREPDYSDPEYRKGVEQAFRDGKRIQYDNRDVGWVHVTDPNWVWGAYKFRIHPEDIDKEIDWKTPEKQAEVRRMWAENPAMERETLGCASQSWMPVKHKNWYEGIFYRPAQKPREKTNMELAKEAFLQARTFQYWNMSTHEEIFIAGWNAREASRKGVA